MITSMEL